VCSAPHVPARDQEETWCGAAEARSCVSRPKTHRPVCQRTSPGPHLGKAKLQAVGWVMSKKRVSDADVVKLTSQRVAAYCQTLAIEPADLPGLIAYVGGVLRNSAASAKPAVRQPGRLGQPRLTAGISPSELPQPCQQSRPVGTNLVDLDAYRRAAFRSSPGRPFRAAWLD
jgi:hypothetical protein